MRRCVMVIARVEGELREGWDLTWYTEQLRRVWTKEEAKSTERVHGQWFSGFGEPYAYVGRESVMRWPEGVGEGAE